MKTYLQMDGDQLVEYVEKRELDELAGQVADFGMLVDKLERELNEAKIQLQEAYDDLLYIATMPEYDQDDCHRLRDLGMKAASKLQAFIHDTNT